MRPATTATIVAAAVLLTPSAAPAARPNKTRTTAQSSATSTTRASSTNTSTAPASIPATTITTATPGGGTTAPLAPPRPANLASGRIALVAYASYLQALVASESTGQANDAAYMSTVDSECKSSLQPLTQGAYAVRPAVQDTLNALGKEIGDDLAISYDYVAAAPLGRLATVLERLRWVHGGRNVDVITNYVTAERAMVGLTPSGLCQDALLAASKPVTTPADTRAFLVQYDLNAKAASAALGGFLALLRAYTSPSERPILQRIATLAGEFAADSKTSLLASGQQLTTSLETS